MDPSRGGRPKRDRGRTRTWKSNDNAETEEILGRQKAAKQAGKQAAKKVAAAEEVPAAETHSRLRRRQRDGEDTSASPGEVIVSKKRAISKSATNKHLSVVAAATSQTFTTSTPAPNSSIVPAATTCAFTTADLSFVATSMAPTPAPDTSAVADATSMVVAALTPARPNLSFVPAATSMAAAASTPAPNTIVAAAQSMAPSASFAESTDISPNEANPKKPLRGGTVSTPASASKATSVVARVADPKISPRQANPKKPSSCAAVSTPASKATSAMAPAAANYPPVTSTPAAASTAHKEHSQCSWKLSFVGCINVDFDPEECGITDCKNKVHHNCSTEWEMKHYQLEQPGGDIANNPFQFDRKRCIDCHPHYCAKQKSQESLSNAREESGEDTIPRVVPHGHTAKAYYKFLDCPKNDAHCESVDEVGGKWHFCGVCERRVMTRERRTFTNGSWDSHKKECAQHLKLLALKEDDERVAAIVASTSTNISKLDRARAKQRSKIKTKMHAYFGGKISHKNQAAAASAPLADVALGVSSSAPAIIVVEAVEERSSPARAKTCEGVFCDFVSDNRLQTNISVYGRNSTVLATSDWKIGMFGTFSQVFATACTGTGGINRGKKATVGNTCCNNCYELRRTGSTRGARMAKIKQTIKIRADKIIRVEESILRSELTHTDYQNMKDFLKTADSLCSVEGLRLMGKVRCEKAYYDEVDKLGKETKKKVCLGSKGMVPGRDKFLDNFLSMYHDEKGGARNSLVFCLLRSYVAKANGHQNPHYGAKVLNFMMALSATNMSAFDLVSANLCSISMRWAKKLRSDRRGTPFILRSKEEMATLVVEKIVTIRKRSNDSSMRVAFTVGVDATVVVGGYQYLVTEQAIVGGASPSHSIDVSNLDKDELFAFLKECAAGRKGEKAAEAKIAVVSFQHTPPGICPYFVLAGLPQTINDSNSWGSEVLEACVNAASTDGNAVVLNESTDGVSCETKWNYTQVTKFLAGKTNVLALPDTNHNIKNLRYQLIGGSSAAVLGSHVFDPALIKLGFNIPKDIVRPSDFASDALALATASPRVVKAILDLHCRDSGNALITVLSLVFMRMRSFAVNARKIQWDERAVFTWSSLLWFTSFQTSGSTMLTNKRNMAMESIAVLFLVTRSDVSQPRRLTSEANEHTYGCLRQSLREFTVEQLIRLVDKQQLKMESIFESNLLTSRSMDGKGYQATFPEFVNSLKASSSDKPPAGPVDVDLSEAAVSQLWPSVRSVIRRVNQYMLPFLKQFGVVEGNGLSPFAKDINDPDELLSLMKDFFKPPKRDPRDQPPKAGNSNSNSSNEVEDSESGVEEEDEDLVNESDFIPAFVEDIASGDESDEANGNVVSIDNTDDDDGSDNGGASVDTLFADDVSGKALLELKELLACSNISSMGRHALSIMELMHLGKIEKGSLMPDGKFKSLNGRWFGTKKKKGKSGDEDEAMEGGGDNKYIERDGLIRMKCERGKSVSIEYYRVLAIFSKHYNKWFVDWDSDKFLFVEGSKKYKVMARMMQKDGEEMKEVELEKDGHWGPRSVYCIKHMSEIVSVEWELNEGLDW